MEGRLSVAVHLASETAVRVSEPSVVGACGTGALSTEIPKTFRAPLHNVRVTDAKEVGVGKTAEETFCHLDAQFIAKRSATVKPCRMIQNVQTPGSGRHLASRYAASSRLAIPPQLQATWQGKRAIRRAGMPGSTAGGDAYRYQLPPLLAALRALW